MKILAISGSVRSESTNTYFLGEISRISSEATDGVQIEIFNSHDELPIFSKRYRERMTAENVKRYQIMVPQSVAEQVRELTDTLNCTKGELFTRLVEKEYKRVTKQSVTTLDTNGTDE